MSKENAVKAALSLAATKGWDHISLSDIAKESGISLNELHTYFQDRFDILAAYGRMVDEKVLQNIGGTGDMPPRDALFDILMERFDVLNEDREGVIAILHSFKRDPKQALFSLPYLGRSMCWMLEACSISTAGIHGCLKIAGLKAVYLNTLRIWMHDESPDMGKTMAALDKNLGHAEGFAMRFGLSEALQAQEDAP